MRCSTLLLALPLGGCSSPGDPADALRCAPTYEFANSGCADLTGVVTDRGGRPLVAATVSAAAFDDRRAALSAGPVQTDTVGRYRLRLTRFSAPPTAGATDTLTVLVIASVPPSAGAPLGTVGPNTQSTLVAPFASVGTRPTVVGVVTLAVPVP